MIGTQDLQSLPRQLRMLDCPLVAVNATSLIVLPSVLRAIVVDVVQVQHPKMPYRTSWDTALDRSPRHSRECAELQERVARHALTCSVAGMLNPSLRSSPTIRFIP